MDPRGQVITGAGAQTRLITASTLTVACQQVNAKVINKGEWNLIQLMKMACEFVQENASSNQSGQLNGVRNNRRQLRGVN